MKKERDRIEELNMLSAYLDNALEAEELEKLKSRLEQDPDLRQKLEDLRHTKVLISRLDRLSVPRNYTLTPDMVKVSRRKTKPLFSTLKLASSFAAILLVALFGVQALLGGGFLASMTAQAPMMEAARVEDESTPEPLILWAQPGVGGAVPDGYGGGSAESFPEESFILEQPSEEEEIAPKDQPVEQPEVPPDMQQAPQESLELESLPTEKDLDGASPILGINTEQGGEVLDRSEPSSADQKAATDWTKMIRWAQVGLAVIAVGGGVTLWILQKKIS
ncbi:MAG: hypothetical protein RQ728_07705 [Brevefilum sp.]|nr:hypothetical protein [Brevefilum sp.]